MQREWPSGCRQFLFSVKNNSSFLLQVLGCRVTSMRAGKQAGSHQSPLSKTSLFQPFLADIYSWQFPKTTSLLLSRPSANTWFLSPWFTCISLEIPFLQFKPVLCFLHVGCRSISTAFSSWVMLSDIGRCSHTDTRAADTQERAHPHVCFQTHLHKLLHVTGSNARLRAVREITHSSQSPCATCCAAHVSETLSIQEGKYSVKAVLKPPCSMRSCVPRWPAKGAQQTQLRAWQRLEWIPGDGRKLC